MMMKQRRCFLGILIFMLIMVVLLFLIVFVVIPVVFKYSISIQRSIIFPTWINGHRGNYTHFGIDGVRNFYVTVDKTDNITLGAWHILPEQIIDTNATDSFYDVTLSDTKYDVLLYLHGNAGVRSLPTPVYAILRKHFQIIAVDYRGYADSSPGELNEENIVNDMVLFYEWIRNRAGGKVYIWAHSLGTGIATHLVSRLKKSGERPVGVVLEAPFTSIPDVMEYNLFIRLISWLPWYRQLTLDAVSANDFKFNSSHHIHDVDSPIMILHAKDDHVVSYELGEQLYKQAMSDRNLTLQGQITYHLFGPLGYGHMKLYLAPELPMFIEDFKTDCVQFDSRTNPL